MQSTLVSPASKVDQYITRYRNRDRYGNGNQADPTNDDNIEDDFQGLGPRDKFEVLAVLFLPVAIRIAITKYGIHPEDADDIGDEVVLRVYKRLTRIDIKRWKGDLARLVNVVTDCVCLSFLERRRRRNRIQPIDGVELEDHQLAEKLRSAQLSEELEDACQHLSQAHVQIIAAALELLSDAETISITSLKSKIGASWPTTAKRLEEAFSCLRSVLGFHYATPE